MNDLKCCYGGPVEKCGKSYCAYRDERASRLGITVPRPIHIQAFDENGKLLTYRNVSTFATIEDMAAWYMSIQKRASFKFVEDSLRYTGTGGASQS